MWARRVGRSASAWYCPAWGVRWLFAYGSSLSLVPALLLGALLSGCFGSVGSAASVVKPRDPTPLAKCKVKASAASPLVTEWPASEKSHLEALLAERAVVVSYNGCELRILESCRVDGDYAFRRTTLSRDTIEINDEDDKF